MYRYIVILIVIQIKSNSRFVDVFTVTHLIYNRLCELITIPYLLRSIRNLFLQVETFNSEVIKHRPSFFMTGVINLMN